MPNARKNFLFSKRDAKISSKLRNNDALTMHRYDTVHCSNFTSDTMPRRQRADAPQTATATTAWTRFCTADAMMCYILSQTLRLWSRFLSSYMSASARELPPQPTRYIMDTGALSWSPLRTIPTLQPLRCWLGWHSHQVRELQHVMVHQYFLPQQWRQRRRFIKVWHG